MEGSRPVLVAAAVLGTVSYVMGLTCLEHPKNVTIHVVNTNITLKWDWDNPCGLNVTFSVHLQRDSEIWAAIPRCQNITITECDLSSTIQDYLESYNVTVRVNTAKHQSLHASLVFIPYMEAQIGPPGVWFESVHGDLKINIVHPEANQQKMWKLERLRYKLTIWKNATHPKEKTQYIFPGESIHDLEPETTYCLKVQACVAHRISFYSPTHCIKTPKAGVDLPRPENVQIHSLNMKHLLFWDDLYKGNVSFMVQLLHGYKVHHSPDVSKDWKNVSGCENILTTHCDLSHSIGSTGIYYLRVQALHGRDKSSWSKMLRFEPIEQSIIGPPNVLVNATEDSLNIFIASPGELENNAMSKNYDFTYHIWYWMDSSLIKKELRDKPPQFIISDLIPSTIYCLEVQAFAETYNKSSAFSNVTCIKTAKGKSSFFLPFFITVAIMILIAGFIYAMYYVWRNIKYAFFPRCNPPMIIESIGEKDLNRLYLLTSEEQTQKCMIINDSATPDRVNLDDFTFEKELEQISQDSGNCSSNDIIISVDKESPQTSELKAVWTKTR